MLLAATLRAIRLHDAMLLYMMLLMPLAISLILRRHDSASRDGYDSDVFAI